MQLTLKACYPDDCKEVVASQEGVWQLSNKGWHQVVGTRHWQWGMLTIGGAAMAVAATCARLCFTCWCFLRALQMKKYAVGCRHQAGYMLSARLERSLLMQPRAFDS